MTSWRALASNGDVRGSEGGVVLLDDEYGDSARITIERDGHVAPFAITCGLYGWMVHTRFFGTRVEAEKECSAMKGALEHLVELASRQVAGADSQAVIDAIGEFVERFP